MIEHEHTLLSSRRFRVTRVSHRGRTGQPLVRDVIRHPGSVAIVPLLNDGNICLIRNWRASVDQSLIEIPAGTLEVGEDPLACARRELTEETGFTAQNWQKLGMIYAAPGILDEVMHLYVATDLAPGDAELEPDEQIENLVVSRSEAMTMIADGRIQDAKTIVGLLRSQ